MDHAKLIVLARHSPLMPSQEEQEDWIAYILPTLSEAEMATAEEIFLKAEEAEKNFEDEKLRLLKEKYEKLKDILRHAKTLAAAAAEEETRKVDDAELAELEKEIAQL